MYSVRVIDVESGIVEDLYKFDLTSKTDEHFSVYAQDEEAAIEFLSLEIGIDRDNLSCVRG